MRVLIVLLLAGCATTDMVKVAEPQSVVVTWTREMPSACGGQPLGQGCAMMSPGFKTCTIWAPESVSDAVLGHELRHCFGYVHERQVNNRPILPAR